MHDVPRPDVRTPRIPGSHPKSYILDLALVGERLWSYSAFATRPVNAETFQVQDDRCSTTLVMSTR
jgi:hypothetical protein